MQPETKFKNKVFEDLKQLKYAWYFKTNQVVRRGVPDIILCIKGYFVAMELKRNEACKPDPLQLYNLHKIRDQGLGYAVVACPENWENVFLFLQRLDSKD